MRFRVLFLVLASLLFTVPAAAETRWAVAQRTTVPEPPSGPTPMRWYGWQTLAVDAVATSVIVGTAIANDDSVLFLNSSETSGKYALAAGLTTYAIGAPIVHLAHGQPGKALASFGLRAGAPLLLGGAGFGAGSALCGGLCGLVGGIPAAIGGMLVAAMVDAGLAKEPVDRAPAISVGVAPVRGGVTAGLSGSF